MRCDIDAILFVFMEDPIEFSEIYKFFIQIEL
jgi:hypothetical protein